MNHAGTWRASAVYGERQIELAMICMRIPELPNSVIALVSPDAAKGGSLQVFTESRSVRRQLSRLDPSFAPSRCSRVGLFREPGEDMVRVVGMPRIAAPQKGHGGTTVIDAIARLTGGDHARWAEEWKSEYYDLAQAPRRSRCAYLVRLSIRILELRWLSLQASRGRI